MQESWNDVKDDEMMVIVKAKLWHRIRDAWLLIRTGKIYTNITWQQLQDRITELKLRR